jgi:SnoaL-like domain
MFGEAARDRLAIRELIDAYARCADRRDLEGQKALFTDETRFIVYLGGEGSEPSDDLTGRAQLTPVFAALRQYETTSHFNGQSTIELLDGHSATGETYCVATHVLVEDGRRSVMAAHLRYRDAFAKEGRDWRFARRELILDLSETRPLAG